VASEIVVSLGDSPRLGHSCSPTVFNERTTIIYEATA
jgi:hypothetical protein